VRNLGKIFCYLDGIVLDGCFKASKPWSKAWRFCSRRWGGKVSERTSTTCSRFKGRMSAAINEPIMTMFVMMASPSAIAISVAWTQKTSLESRRKRSERNIVITEVRAHCYGLSYNRSTSVRPAVGRRGIPQDNSVTFIAPVPAIAPTPTMDTRLLKHLVTGYQQGSAVAGMSLCLISRQALTSESSLTNLQHSAWAFFAPDCYNTPAHVGKPGLRQRCLLPGANATLLPLSSISGDGAYKYSFCHHLASRVLTSVYEALSTQIQQ